MWKFIVWYKYFSDSLVIFQKQLSEGKFALLSCEELLEFANQTLTITNEEEFLKVEQDEDEETLTPNPPYRIVITSETLSVVWIHDSNNYKTNYSVNKYEQATNIKYSHE